MVPFLKLAFAHRIFQMIMHVPMILTMEQLLLRYQLVQNQLIGIFPEMFTVKYLLRYMRQVDIWWRLMEEALPLDQLR